MKLSDTADLVLDQKSDTPRVLFPSLLLGAAIFILASFGIFTRPSGALASFWPANAFLLGMLVRFPKLANGYSWAAATIGYCAADLLTGGSLLATILLTLGNLAGAAVGYVALARLNTEDRQLQRPVSIFLLLLVLIAASSAAGIVGTVANPILFNRTALGGFGWWFVAELVNYIAIVPVLLTIPERLWLLGDRRRSKIFSVTPAQLAPLGALLLSVAASVVIGGPGAVAFPVPALLWCAVSYRLFTTTVLTLALSAWTLLSLSAGLIEVPVDMNNRHAVISLRLAVTMVALAPLIVGSVMAARNQLMERLSYLATHDNLTGLLNRHGFFEQATGLISEPQLIRRPLAMLMLDIDRFKFINDTYGHQVGDKVLVNFAECLRRCLRQGDICGRLGGEEFAAILPDCTQHDAETAAYRILRAFSESHVESGADSVTATVSIGVAAGHSGVENLDALMLGADRALYRAKLGGRNRVEVSRTSSAG